MLLLSVTNDLTFHKTFYYVTTRFETEVRVLKPLFMFQMSMNFSHGLILNVKRLEIREKSNRFVYQNFVSASILSNYSSHDPLT